jgi:PITH domain
VKFQSVQHLTIFIEDNQGDEDATRIQKIALYGLAGQKMDVKAMKKIAEDGTEQPLPQAK